MKIYHYILIALFYGAGQIIQAKEITLPHQNLMLSANLILAQGKSLSEGAILITHGGLMHRDMEIIGYLQDQLKDLGYNTLAINLSLGLNNRQGAYDCKNTHHHQHTDAADEIDTWMKWLSAQDTQQVVLLGHSRGAGQTALYLSEHNHSLIKGAVLMAPQTSNNGGAGYEQRYGTPLQPLLSKASKLVRTGNGSTVLEHVNMMFCRDTRATAEAFVSYYGADPRLDSPWLISKLKVPTLVVVAGADEVVIDLDKKIAPLIDNKHIQMSVIEGADHMFRDLNADDAIEMINEFLSTLTQKQVF